MMTLQDREFRGSRLRCLMLTSMPRPQVASILTQLISPIGLVDANRHQWAPRGFAYPEEAKLSGDADFLTPGERELLTGWWLKVRRNANTPNWDLVSQGEIDGQRGMILVEAKAHTDEVKCAGKEKGNVENDSQIAKAIGEANSVLNDVTPGWSLTKDSHYQLCNRFAFTWKLAAMGIPTILVYLGFLHCDEMSDCGTSFESAQDWERTLADHSKSVVPPKAWGGPLQTSGAPMWAIARALDLEWIVSGARPVFE